MAICSSLRNRCARACDYEWNSGLRVLQYLPRSVDLNKFDFLKPRITGRYTVDIDSTQHMLAGKLWRLNSLLQHDINIEICFTNYFNNSVGDEDVRRLVKVMQIGSLNGLQPVSIQHLDYAVKWRTFHNIIKQLDNSRLRELRVWLEMESGDTTERICEALNKLPRLRSLVVVRNDDLDDGNSSSALLFSHLRYANIVLPPVDVRDINGTALAYKWLELRFKGPVEVGIYVEIIRRCTRLKRLRIDTKILCDLTQSLPPDLLSLEVMSYPSCLQQCLSPQISLTRLVLHNLSGRDGRVKWGVMAVWCPNVRYLTIYHAKIEGPVTRLPLTELHLSKGKDHGDTVIVRHACERTLHRLSISAWLKSELDRELEDWIANPEFLIGANVICRWAKGPGRIHTNRISSRKRVILFTREALQSIGY